jgi:hypothetical protein
VGWAENDVHDPRASHGMLQFRRRMGTRTA